MKTIKFVKLLLLVILVNILICINLSKKNFIVLINVIKYIINTKYHEEHNNLKYHSINNKYLSLVLFIIIKIFSILFIPLISLVFQLFLIYISIFKEENFRLRFLRCYVEKKNGKYNTYIDKHLWYKLFNKFNIPTPQNYAILNKDYKLKIFDKSFSYDKKYIFKPHKGFGGRSIFYDSYNNIKKKNIKFDEPMVIQERIYDCKYGSNRSRHFRINTYYNKKLGESKLINFFMMTSGKGKLASNLKSGASIVDCEDLSNCNILSKKEKRLLVNIKDKLLLFHNIIKYTLIGWDIVLDCDTAYVLEGNICPGTAFMNEKTQEIYDNIINDNY